MQKTSIVMVCFPDQLIYLKDSIDSIRRYTEKGSYELIVVDNSGDMEVKKWLSEQIDIRTIFAEHSLSMSEAWNEGAKIVLGENILFTHADILASFHWLTSLSNTLYNEIAMAGPLTNNSGNSNSAQDIDVEFSSIDEMVSYASHLNQLPIKTEESLTISDFSFIIRRDIVEQAGKFDEDLRSKELLTDYALRIRQLGWKVAISRNSFVYHYGIDPNNHNNYSSNFLKKWGVTADEICAQNKAVEQIQQSIEDQFTVLIIGPDLEATSIRIISLYPNADIYGYNPHKAESTKFRISSYYEEIHFQELNQEFFDYILMNSMVDLEKLLLHSRRILNKDGQVITEVFNSKSILLIESVLLGDGINNHKRYWDINDITKVFEQHEFAEIDLNYQMHKQSSQSMRMIDKMQDLVGTLPQELEVSSFVISARRTSRNDILHALYDRLLQNPTENILKKIISHSRSQLLVSLETYRGEKIAFLNYLALALFEMKKFDEVVPYLTKAYELDPANDTTILNLATIEYSLGNDNEAYAWLCEMANKNENTLRLLDRIKNQINSQLESENKIKYLLRRIERDVERDDAINEVLGLISSNRLNIDSIKKVTNQSIYNKSDTLNRLAVSCFSASKYDLVIPLLEESYRFNPESEDTLYNLGYFLYKFGAYSNALSFLNQINEADEETKELRREIEELIDNE